MKNPTSLDLYALVGMVRSGLVDTPWFFELPSSTGALEPDTRVIPGDLTQQRN